jgi:hypothetical protein
MSKKKPPSAPQSPRLNTPPVPPALPPVLQDFIKAIQPKAGDQGPAEELTTRFRETRREENIRGMIVPGGPKSGPEYIVELRIREWMYRMEREAADRRHQDAAKPKNPPPKP